MVLQRSLSVLFPREFAVAALLIGLVVFVGVGWNVYWQLRFWWYGLKGPRPWPFIMNMGTVIRLKGGFNAWRFWKEKYGDVYCAFIGSRPMIMLSHPALAREVLGGKRKEFLDRGPNPLPSLALGDERTFERAGVVFANGRYWAGLRATYAHYLMHSEALRLHYYAIMTQSVETLLRSLRRKEGTVVDVSVALASLTMEVIGRTGFGHDLAVQEDFSKHSDILKATAPFFDASSVLRNPYLMVYAVFPYLGLPLKLLAKYFPLGSQKELNDGRRKLMGVIQGWIEDAKRAEALEKGQGKAEGGGDLEGRRPPEPGSFLRVVMKSIDKTTGEPYSDLKVASQVLTLLLAGYETTSVTISLALYLLARHPAKLRLLQEEIDRNGRSKVPDSAELLDSQTYAYAEAVVAETLRIYPVTVVTGRFANEDATIGNEETGLHRIPKGALLLVNMMNMQNDPRFWEAPAEFQPERFLPGNKEKIIPGAYQPFGGGSRVCPGQKFALLEATLALVRVCSEFDVAIPPGMYPPGDGIELKQGITMSSVHGVPLKITRRM